MAWGWMGLDTCAAGPTLFPLHQVYFGQVGFCGFLACLCEHFNIQGLFNFFFFDKMKSPEIDSQIKSHFQ